MIIMNFDLYKIFIFLVGFVVRHFFRRSENTHKAKTEGKKITKIQNVKKN